MEDSGSIPNLISLSQIPVNMMTRLETDLLEPVVFNQGSTTQDGFCRFTLQNKGFLHSHSKLFMSVKAPTGVTTGAFFNPTTGIGQVVKKAVLKIGNKTLNEVSSWDSLFAVKSSLIKSENNKEREQFTTGRFMAHSFVYDTGSAVEANSYGIDNGLEYSGATLKTPSWAMMLAATEAEDPTFSIDLSDLFPFLKVNQLPLYMINEAINIELTFYPTSNHRVQVSVADDANKANAAEINRPDIKFCADYVYYGESDEMTRFAEQNKDMSFSFVDYRLSEMSVSNTSLASGVIRNIGMANRVVPRVITTLADSARGSDALLSAANAQSPVLTGGVPGTVKYNARYNDAYTFTSDVENTARLFSILTESEGVPFLTRDEFSNEKENITTHTLNGYAQQTDLGGQFFYLGTKLNDGRIGNRGLELNISGAFPASTDVMRSFSEYLRVARLSDGLFDVFNA